MGYDTSYHPLDLSLVADRLLPYLAGHGADDALDDLVARAVAIRKTRFRAKAWALGAHRVARDDDALPWEPHLHLWGRPFLLVADTPERLAEDLRRYLDTRHDQVDALAREMLGRLDPALPDRVEPDRDGRLPGDEVLADSLATPLRLLRAAGVAVRAGRRTVRHPDGREFEAAPLFVQEVPFHLLRFAAALLPGWMSRGHTWPTRLLADAGLPATGFTASTALTALLREEFPDLDWPVPDATIVGNYMVGGLVPAERVGVAHGHLSRHRDALDGDPLEVRKLLEALAVAACLGTGFVEATEVYSGMTGELN